jgi:porphobilinogen deaminase
LFSIYYEKITNPFIITPQMMKIGTLMTPWAKLFGIYTHRELKQNLDLDTQIAYYHSETELFNALLLGEVQAVPMGLKDLPTTLQKGINIAALSNRDTVAYALLSLVKNKDEHDLFNLKNNARVWVHSDIDKAQMQQFRSDLIIEINNLSPTEVIEATREGVYDAFVFTVVTVEALGLREDEFSTVKFSPKEFVTEPGQGVVALLTSEEDISTRKILKQIHQKEVALVTNVERQLKKLFADKDVAAYCQHDAGGNFHLWAAAIINGELKRTRLSHSTSFELAERCFEILNQNK